MDLDTLYAWMVAHRVRDARVGELSLSIELPGPAPARLDTQPEPEVSPESYLKTLFYSTDVDPDGFMDDMKRRLR